MELKKIIAAAAAIVATTAFANHDGEKSCGASSCSKNGKSMKKADKHHKDKGKHKGKSAEGDAKKEGSQEMGTTP